MKRTNGPCSAARLLGVLIAIAQCALPVAAQDDCTPQVAGRYVPATPANALKAVFYFPW